VAIISTAAHCADDELPRPETPPAECADTRQADTRQDGRATAGKIASGKIDFSAAGAMAVLIAVPTVDAGAADEGAVELAHLLGTSGHRAVVVSSGGRLEADLAACGAETLRLDMASRSPLAMVRNAFVLKRIVAQRRCAVVHALARGPAWSALLAARMAGVPFLTTWYNGFREQNAFKRFYNSVMARGERVIAVNARIADAIAASYSHASGRIVVVPSRVDPAAFDPALVTPQRIAAVRSAWDIRPDARAIVVTGRILRRKGHHVVVRAAARLKEMGLRDFTFVFIGEDHGHSSYAGELWDLVLATGTSDVVRLVGPPDDLRAAYGAATAVLSPVIQLEGSQRSLLEAMAMARPVIASDLAAGPDTVLAPPAVAEDRMTGFTFQSGDDQELAGALIRLLSAPESVRAAVGRRGRDHALTRFAAEDAAAQMLALYAELARRRH
jgi:glycosyltransferase involved in cell wall biosynthesis